MAQYTDIVQNDYGLPIPGVQVYVLNSDGSLASLTNSVGSPIINPVLTDASGVFLFNAADGVYGAEFRFGGSTIREDKIIVGNPPQYVGPTGPSNNTRVSLATLKAASIGDLTSLYDDSLWTWQTANAPYTADDINIVKANSTALSVGAWVRSTGYSVQAEKFGLSVSGSAAANAQAILRAIQYLRTNAVTLSTDGLNGGSFTAYASGQLLIGNGVFAIAPDTLRITQDLGLVIKGVGSRKTNNSVVGRTVLLITGTSSGYGLQVYGNGARGLVLEDLDICYASSAFTGDCLDNFGAPGMTLNRVHLGTNGITGGTRLQTARSCVRATYDEFCHFIDTTFDGSVDGWWSDDTRQPPSGPSIEFGGSQTIFDNCVFYDFTGTMIRHDGNRNRKGLTINRSSLNPISVSCTRGLDLNNVDGLDIRGPIFTASVSNYATSGWLRIVNCTGGLHSSWFGDYCPIGSIGGNIDISNNFYGGTDGVTLTGGLITGKGNEFSQGTTGYIVAPTSALTFRLGPDAFRAAVGRSYDIATDSTFLDGHIIYSATQDASTNRFRNVSARVTIRNNDEKSFGITAATYTPGREDSGRTVRAEGTTAQTFTLPAITNIGLSYRFVRNGGFDLTVQSPTAGKLYVGGGGGKTSMTAPAGDIGAIVEVQNLDGSGWNVTTRTGGWTFA